MPALVPGGGAYPEGQHIGDFFSFFFPKPPLLSVTEGAAEGTGRVFPAIARFFKTTDPAGDGQLKAALMGELIKIGRPLQELAPTFLGGDEVSPFDCSLAPKLPVLKVAGGQFKPDFQIPDSLTSFQKYMLGVFFLGGFISPAPPADVVFWGWEQARGVWGSGLFFGGGS
eukprot:FR742406.1.p1 GENE.FR742406.1~~FR742406.1.p1  ORF type:complete len:170 (-),score=36.36 FR742406.1:148-657(-)